MLSELEELKAILFAHSAIIPGREAGIALRLSPPFQEDPILQGGMN